MAYVGEQIGRGGVDRAVAGVGAEISEGRRRALHGQQIAGTAFHGALAAWAWVWRGLSLEPCIGCRARQKG
jgi:hypothetical protein